jgi:hypothetical protein
VASATRPLGATFPLVAVQEQGTRTGRKAPACGRLGNPCQPALRAAGARQTLHGPHDWKHLNETGYRLLGALVAQHLEDRPADACDDRWPEASP